MPRKKADHLVHILIDIFAVRIAPSAVFLVELSVRLPADNIILQRHPAALTDQLFGRSEDRVDRNTEEF